MSLAEAIDILKKHKEAVSLIVSSGNGNEQMGLFIDAVDTVISWIDRMYSVFMKFGK